MLPEIGAAEMIVIAAVALIVVGPKDLPMMLRKLGQMVGKVRLLAADFRASFDDMARQSELDDLRREVEALRNTKLTDTLGPLPTFEELSQGAQPSDPAPYDPHAAAIEAEGAGYEAGYEESPSILPPPAETVTEAPTQVQTEVRPGEPSPETRT
jgi:sec-independent protein translocase protein TatB